MLYSNRLLNALTTADLNRLQQSLEPTPLRAKQILHWPDQPIDDVYFIEDGLVSVLANTGNKRPVEVWLIGSEGLVGLPVLLDGFPSPHRRVVQVPGHALRIGAHDLAKAMQDSVSLRRVLLRYVQANLIQASQSGGCAARHTASQRLARWLLLAHDRTTDDQLPVTHSLLSGLMGVRRATVTVSLGVLEEAGGIRQIRGTVVVVDRKQLERAACRCYGIIAAAYENVSATARTEQLACAAPPQDARRERGLRP